MEMSGREPRGPDKMVSIFESVISIRTGRQESRMGGEGMRESCEIRVSSSQGGGGGLLIWETRGP
jgi:hypothetical protein